MFFFYLWVLVFCCCLFWNGSKQSENREGKTNDSLTHPDRIGWFITERYLKVPNGSWLKSWHLFNDIHFQSTHVFYKEWLILTEVHLLFRHCEKTASKFAHMLLEYQYKKWKRRFLVECLNCSFSASPVKTIHHSVKHLVFQWSAPLLISRVLLDIGIIFWRWDIVT